MAGVAVVAALKLRFARAVALGNSLGDIAAGPVKRIVAPVLRFVLPQDYKKWAGPVVGTYLDGIHTLWVRILLTFARTYWRDKTVNILLMIPSKMQQFLPSSSLPSSWPGPCNASSPPCTAPSAGAFSLRVRNLPFL